MDVVARIIICIFWNGCQKYRFKLNLSFSFDRPAVLLIKFCY